MPMPFAFVLLRMETLIVSIPAIFQLYLEEASLLQLIQMQSSR